MSYNYRFLRVHLEFYAIGIKHRTEAKKLDSKKTNRISKKIHKIIQYYKLLEHTTKFMNSNIRIIIRTSLKHRF